MNKYIILIFCLAGCAPVHLDCLSVIEQKICTEDYKCYQKSRDASKCFRAHGYNAYPVCGPVDGLERHHCWVEIKNNGKIYWYDPTWVSHDSRYSYWEKSKYTDRTIFRAKQTGKVKYPIKNCK